MTNSDFAALPTTSAGPRSRRVRLLSLCALISLCAAALAMLLLASSASAVVTEVPTAATVGLQPRSVKAPVDGDGPTAASFANAAGNPVLHGAAIYDIYWDPGDDYHGDWKEHINNFLQQLGAASGSLGNVFAVPTQFTDKTNVPATYADTFRGTGDDYQAYPASGCTSPGLTSVCLTDQQIREQLQSYITTHGLPTGMGVIYYLLTPPRVAVCLDAASTHCTGYTRSGTEKKEKAFRTESYEHSFCSYHSDINPDAAPAGDAKTILYATIPWVALSPQAEPGYECQDGGYDPSSKPPEEAEAPKEKTAKEEEEFAKDTKKEKEAIIKAEELEGPHIEEPNQDGLSPDGTYDGALSDLIINQIALEQINIVTDPLLDSWKDSANLESTDECRNYFAAGPVSGSVTADENTLAGGLSTESLAGGQYYIQSTFNFAAYRLAYPGVPCLAAVNLVPAFTAPNPVNVGDIVGFDGMESDIDLNAGIDFSASGLPQANYATYSWDFGDGTPDVSGFAPGAPLCEAPWLSPCAASVFHTYAAGGTYKVTLTATDVGGHTTSITQPVTVIGAPSVSSSGTGGGSTSTVGGGSSSGSGSGQGSVPAPVVSAAVTSRSLRTALKKGLVVRYSVNEQVAGHFEVLISRSLAKHLKIGGAAATGLPAGTPPQVMIAKAVLITTKGGHSTITIKLSKTVAGRLSHTHKVSLLLRLVVRNASKSPATATLISSVTLTG